jgi:hypothetical protein
VLSFQVYLGLPIAVGGGSKVAYLFVLSAAMAVLGQLRLTQWVKQRWSPEQAIVRGLWLMGAAFVPLTVAASLGSVLLTTALLTLATMIVYPFEMATIARLGGDQLIGTYYGFYNTLSGLGIAAGNLATGAALDESRPLTWWSLIALGWGCATAVSLLNRTGRLRGMSYRTVRGSDG